MANLEDIIKKSFKVAKDVITVGGAALLSYSYVGLSGLITGLSFNIGYSLIQLKKKAKIKYKQLKGEFHIGNIMGSLTNKTYSIINSIQNDTVMGILARTFAFNPLYLTLIYNPIYLGLNYLKENVPVKKFFKNMITLRIYPMLKDVYHNGIKPVWKAINKKILWFMPLHSYSTNFIKNIQQQVAFSALSSTAYRVVVT